MKAISVKRIYIVLMAVVFILIFFIDNLSLKNPNYGKYGTMLWFFSYIFLFIFAFRSLVYLVRFKNKFTLLIILPLIFIVLMGTVSPKNLSGETTQEINCTLNLLNQTVNKGFKETCLFGYPARQYFLPALPSLFFGRSQFNLNFSGTIYFILGIIIFAGGLNKYLLEEKNGDLLTTIVLSFIPHLHYFNFFIFHFEQSIYPFSLGLILVGLFLYFIKEKSMELLLLLGLTIYYLIFSYTPSLSLVFLSLISGVYFLIRYPLSKKLKVSLGVIIMVLLEILLTSLFLRYDINIKGEEFNIQQIQANLVNTFNHLLFASQGKPMVSSFFLPILLFSLFFSLININKIELFFPAIWILLVIITSVLAKGYSYYGIDFRFHRATIIFPVLFLMIAKIIKLNKINWTKHFSLLGTLLLFFYITGFLYQRQYLQGKESARHLAVINWLKSKIEKKEINKSGYIYFSNAVSNEYISLHDSLQYFIPEMNYSILDKNCQLLNSDMEYKKAYFFMLEDEVKLDCFTKIQLSKIADYNFEKDKKLIFYTNGK